MLEYFKTILSKVSFNESIFEKELNKAVQSLVEDEVIKLKSWCYDQFGEIHHIILNKQFSISTF